MPLEVVQRAQPTKRLRTMPALLEAAGDVYDWGLEVLELTFVWEHQLPEVPTSSLHVLPGLM
eukprot:6742688-Lingulodinium_polyedra.AAC.1